MSVFAAYEPLPVTPRLRALADERKGRQKRMGDVAPKPKPVVVPPPPAPHKPPGGLRLLGSGGWRTILALVSLKHGVSEETMMGKSRVRAALEARREAIVLIYTHTRLSSPQIGAIFGGRDHTTVLHAMRVAGLRPVKCQGSGKPRKDGLVYKFREIA